MFKSYISFCLKRNAMHFVFPAYNCNKISIFRKGSNKMMFLDLHKFENQVITSNAINLRTRMTVYYYIENSLRLKYWQIKDLFVSQYAVTFVCRFNWNGYLNGHLNRTKKLKVLQLRHFGKWTHFLISIVNGIADLTVLTIWNDRTVKLVKVKKKCQFLIPIFFSSS